MKLKSFFWITPFLSFLIGYFTVRTIFSINQKIDVPRVIGLQLQDAVKILSDKNLNIRIIAEKEDSDLPDNTIMSQNPVNAEVKPLQSVYLTISKKPNQKLAPNFLKKTILEIEKHSKKNGIKIKTYYVKSNLEKDKCVGQLPIADEILKENRMIVYASSSNKKNVIFPNFKGLDIRNVLEFLKLYSISPQIINQTENTKNSLVIDQRPIAGSIVNLEKINVQIKI